MTDLQVVINAVSEARRVLLEYAEPESSNAEGTVQQLREILDVCELRRVVERLERCGSGLLLTK